MGSGAEREDAFLGARLLLVAPRAAKRGIEFVFVERLLQGLRLHHLCMQCRARVERIDAALKTILVHMHDQAQAKALRGFVAKADHLMEFPGRIDMEKRKRWLGRIEGLHRQMKHYRRILPDRVEHHRVLELGGNLADDLNAFGFEALQMRYYRFYAGQPGRPHLVTVK